MRKFVILCILLISSSSLAYVSKAPAPLDLEDENEEVISIPSVVQPSNTPWMMGSNMLGQFPNLNETIYISPVSLPPSTHSPLHTLWNTHTFPSSIHLIAHGLDHSIAVLDNGEVYVWGDASLGQLGVMSHHALQNATRGTPIRIPLFTQLNSPVVQVDANGDQTAVLMSNGDCYVWGAMGNHIVTTPTKVNGKFVSIHLGFDFAVALDTSHHIWVWGSNHHGQLGMNTSDIFISTPTKHPFFKDMEVAHLFVGSFHTLTLVNNSLYAFGDNEHGQLGVGDFDSHSLPIQVNAPTFTHETLLTACAGRGHSLLISTSGNVWSWGLNSHGQLGLGDRRTRFNPTRLIPLEGKGLKHCHGDLDFTVAWP